ncbi:hypothetical protein [Fluviicola sp.]|uniref:hypothetical protein n=1 Tax=Fluviicola sp. TaxID=1917219 RepID=UPI0031D289DF
MKKFMIAAVAVTTTLFANAQADTKTQETTQTAVAVSNPDKVQIKVEELPAAVQTALKADAFQGWAPKTAYIVKAEKPYYEVELTNAQAEATVVKFNEDGTVIK